MRSPFVACIVLSTLPLSAISAQNASQVENKTIEMSPIVVIAAQNEPTKVYIDATSPVQPIPSLDGAGVLKAAPGFSVIRKGGISGDPLLRGLGGSRLSITANDNFLYGGCGGRMDPPTAYVFPNSYDRVVVTKGPQTVVFPGIITGSVQFLRDDIYFEETGANGDIGVTAGSFGRFDTFADVTAGSALGYIRLNGTYSKSDDYKDGGGKKVHSGFNRNSQTIQLGVTPDRYTLVELMYDRSRGKAAYADRIMDGTKFDRDAYGVKISKDDIGDFLSRIYFQYGYSYVDHVMDNYNLREIAGMYRASNPDRRVNSASLKADFSLLSADIKTGVDWMSDRHRFRGGSGVSKDDAEAYQQAQRAINQKADNVGVFTEANIKLSDKQALIAGLRYDKSGVDYFNNGVAGNSRDFDLFASFLRYEYYKDGFTYFAGLGFAQRIPDFWERNKNRELKKESNTQIDVGVLYKDKTLRGSLNFFVSQISDFILVYSNNTAENIDTLRYGIEGEAEWRFVDNFKFGGAASYVYGKNRSYDRPLGQTPPLELRGFIGYDDEILATSLLVRYAAPQHRVAIGEGNIVGQDFKESGGFAIFSINGSWKINKNISLLFGVDNIFDKEYSEFINKKNSSINGYNQPIGDQISEPGRQFWARIQGSF